MSGTAIDELALIGALAEDLGVPRPPAGRVERIEHEPGGHRVSGLKWGDGEAGLVLLHGGSLNAHAWDRMMLVHEELDALALDLPGHGHSGWFEDPVYLPEDLARAIAPAIEILGGRPAVLVGHSLGGLTALALAATRPELVAALVLVDATPGSTPERSEDLLEFVSARDFASFEEFLDHVTEFKPYRERESLRRSLLLNGVETEDGRWTWRHDGRLRRGLDRWAITFREMPRGWDHAAALTCPTLVIRGERSEIMLASDVERYQELVRDLRVIQIDGAGHNVHGDRPVQLGAAISEFLSEIGASE